MVFDPEFLKPFPSVLRYFNTMVHQPAFAKVIGKVELCTKATQYNRARARMRCPPPAVRGVVCKHRRSPLSRCLLLFSSRKMSPCCCAA